VVFQGAHGGLGRAGQFGSYLFEGQTSLRWPFSIQDAPCTTMFKMSICPPLCFVFGWRGLQTIEEGVNCGRSMCRLSLKNKLTFYFDMSPYFMSLHTYRKVSGPKAGFYHELCPLSKRKEAHNSQHFSWLSSMCVLSWPTAQMDNLHKGKHMTEWPSWAPLIDSGHYGGIVAIMGLNHFVSISRWESTRMCITSS